MHQRHKTNKRHLPQGVYDNLSTIHPYKAMITLDAKQIYLGGFATIEEARKKYLTSSREAHLIAIDRIDRELRRMK